MKHIGTQEIRTERLLLRKIKIEDYKDMYEWTSKEEVSKYVSWSTHKTPNDTKELCKMWVSEYENLDRYNWGIVCGDKVIGNIDVVKFLDTTAFLGWQCDSSYWNQGVMTEAATAVRDFLFTQVGVERIEAAHIQQNIGSGRVMQKIGMKKISIIKAMYYQIRHKTKVDGMPLICYKLTKDEWRVLNDN